MVRDRVREALVAELQNKFSFTGPFEINGHYNDAVEIQGRDRVTDVVKRFIVRYSVEEVTA